MNPVFSWFARIVIGCLYGPMGIEVVYNTDFLFVRDQFGHIRGFNAVKKTLESVENNKNQKKLSEIYENDCFR